MPGFGIVALSACFHGVDAGPASPNVPMASQAPNTVEARLRPFNRRPMARTIGASFTWWVVLAGALVMLELLLVTAAAGADDDEAAGPIRDLEARINRAVVSGDVTTFDALLSDDFTHTSHTGRFRTKMEWLKDVKPGRSLYSAYDVDDQSIRLYGETAVVTGRISPKGTNSQGQPIAGQYRYIRVWVKRDGQWRAVSFQGTRIQESQP